MGRKRSSLAFINFQLNRLPGVQEGCFWMPDEVVEGVVRPVAFVVPREGVQHEEAVALRAALAVHALELGAPRQAAALGATLRAHGPQTVRRLRPLSRRRLSTRRPARVRIRARNPCVRARLRFLG